MSLFINCVCVYYEAHWHRMKYVSRPEKGRSQITIGSHRATEGDIERHREI